MMTVQEYLKLPYTIIVKHIDDESGSYYTATVLELDGCRGTGETPQEAYSDVMFAMEGYIETKLANGFDVPIPAKEEKYSGKFVLRMPKSLHQSLSLKAAQEGVSLNQYALYKLSQA